MLCLSRLGIRRIRAHTHSAYSRRTRVGISLEISIERTELDHVAERLDTLSPRQPYTLEIADDPSPAPSREIEACVRITANLSWQDVRTLGDLAEREGVSLDSLFSEAIDALVAKREEAGDGCEG